MNSAEPSEDIYFLVAKRVRRVKIGITFDLDKRIRVLQAGSPVPLILLFSFPGTLQNEQKLHRFFDEERTHAEWFKVTPRLLAFVDHLRTFTSTAAIDEYIRELKTVSWTKPEIHRERGDLIRAAIEEGCRRRHVARRSRLFANLERMFAERAGGAA